MAYFNHEDQRQNDCGSQKEPDAQHHRVGIDEITQSIGRDYDNCQDKAGHIGAQCDGLGIIKALYLHVPSGK